MAIEIARRLADDGVTWVTGPVQEDAGGSGGAAILGPFVVAHDTPNLTTGYVTLHTFDGVYLLMTAFVIITEEWQSGGAGDISPEVTVDPDVSNWILWNHSVLGESVGYGPWPTIGSGWKAAKTTNGTKVACDAFGQDPIAGELEVYLLVSALA